MDFLFTRRTLRLVLAIYRVVNSVGQEVAITYHRSVWRNWDVRTGSWLDVGSWRKQRPKGHAAGARVLASNCWRYAVLGCSRMTPAAAV
jgi:hypothetical protein